MRFNIQHTTKDHQSFTLIWSVVVTSLSYALSLFQKTCHVELSLYLFLPSGDLPRFPCEENLPGEEEIINET